MNLNKRIEEVADNTSEFLRVAAEEKLERMGHEDTLMAKRQSLTEEINRIDEILESKKKSSKKIEEILRFAYEGYKREWILYDDDWQALRIQERVLPALKEIGCTDYSVKDILMIFRKRHALEKEEKANA